MADLPVTAFPAQTVVTGTPQLIGSEILAYLGSAEATTGAWPVTNTAIFIPWPLSSPFLAAKMYVLNGGTVSGNIDVGIYDSQGNLIVSKGSTAQSGTSAIQTFDITDTTLNPGLYYLAVAMDNTTGIINHWVPTAINARMSGVLMAASSFALPATVTYAALTQAFIPTISVTGQTAI